MSRWRAACREKDTRQYQIQQLAPAPETNHVVCYSRAVADLLALAASVYYTTLRLTYLWHAVRQQSQVAWASVMFLIIDVGLNFANCTEYIWGLSTFHNCQQRPRLRLVGSKVPFVDLFIATCGEDIRVIMDTVRAACVIDWPQDAYRIIIADDGADPALEHTLDQLRRTFPNIHYHARFKAKGVPHGFKAGNIHNALKFADGLPGGRSAWFSVLDCDLIPEKGYLRALTAHVVNHPQRGMAQLPQRYYNIPTNDPLGQDQNFQFDGDELVRDPAGACWCIGSGFVVRRQAFDDIGGFSETSPAEDIPCGMMLCGRGWEVVYVHENLQWGLMPDTLAGHVKQRTRWSVAIQRHNTSLLGAGLAPILAEMNFSQRLACFTYCFNGWSSTVTPVASLLSVMFCLLHGAPLVVVTGPTQLHMLLVGYTATRLTQLLCDRLSSIPYGFHAQRTMRDSGSWLSFYRFQALIQDLLPKSLGGARQVFTATGAQASAINERDRKVRPGLMPRLRLFAGDPTFCLFPLVCAALVAATWYSIRNTLAGSSTPEALHHDLVAGVLWPGSGWSDRVSLMVPVWYALWPPNMPARRDCMFLDPEDRCYRPRPEYRRPRWSAAVWVAEIPHSLALIWSLVSCCL